MVVVVVVVVVCFYVCVKNLCYTSGIRLGDGFEFRFLDEGK